jgi:hypothetical protein
MAEGRRGRLRSQKSASVAIKELLKGIENISAFAACFFDLAFQLDNQLANTRLIHWLD